MSITLSSHIQFGYLLAWNSSQEDITEALALNEYLPEPFFVACLLPSVSLDVESLDDTPVKQVVFGVEVDTDTDIEQLLLLRGQMDEMLSNPFLEGFQFATTPRFYSGIPWMPSDDSDESDESDESDIEEELDESDESDESDIEEELDESDEVD